MKTLVLMLALLSFYPNTALAHGGVEKASGNTLVYLNQSPISPLVGEEVKMSFVVGRPGTTERLQDLEVKLTVTDTFPDDASKDKVILEETRRTDANGAIDFAYTFQKDNYFDVELEYTDPSNNQAEEAGFLVQTRNRPQAQNRPNNSILLLASGVIIGIAGTKILTRTKTAL